MRELVFPKKPLMMMLVMSTVVADGKPAFVVIEATGIRP